MATYYDIISRVSYETSGEKNISTATALFAKQEQEVKAIINKQEELKKAIAATYVTDKKGSKEAIAARKVLNAELNKTKLQIKDINIAAQAANKAAKQAEQAANKATKQAAQAANKAAKQAAQEANRAAKQAEQAANKAAKQATQTQTGSDGGGLGGVASALGFAGFAATAAASAAAIVSLTVDFEGYEAQLKTALGTTEKAKAALLDISAAAAQTPESVQSLTEAYARLANTGLQPTIDELLNITDVAISQNKSVMSFTEALIDAQTMEFERLKEFGILASKNGDKVTFTFKNQKTEVAATSTAIRAYLIGLGEVEGVSGAAAEKSKTLGGAFSNLGDSLARLAVTIGSKVSPALTSMIRLMTSGLDAIGGFLDKTSKATAAAAEQGISLAKFNVVQFAEITQIAEESQKLASKTFEGLDAIDTYTERTKSLRAFAAAIRETTELTDDQRAVMLNIVNDDIRQVAKAYQEGAKQDAQRVNAAEQDKASAAKKVAQQQAKEREKQAKQDAEQIAKIRKDAAKDILKDIVSLEREIETLILNSSPDSIEKIRAQNKIERDAAQERIDERRKELKEQKALTPELQKYLLTLEQLTDRRFDVDLNIDLGKFNAELESVKKQLLKTVTDGQAAATIEALQLNKQSNAGNIFGSYVAGLQFAAADAAQTIDKINADFEGKKEGINKSILDAQSKAVLLDKAAVENEMLLANASAAASQVRIGIYSDYLDAIIKLNADANRERLRNNTIETDGEITRLNAAYAGNLISAKDYESEMTRIQGEAADERAEITIRDLISRRKLITSALSGGAPLSDVQKQSLAEELKNIESEIASITREKSESGGSGTQSSGFFATILGVTDENAARIVSLAERTAAQVIDTLKQANQAEIERTNLLIAEQEKRVDAAERIADGGNAEQLELERKRLDGLQKQREAYVQKQRELNAILAASNFAAATAEAVKGISAAAAEGGIFAAITVPLYLASIGLGITSLLSLLDQTQSGIGGFWAGVVGLKADGTGIGAKRGRKQRHNKDTIPAFLAVGESVMTAKATEKYSGALAAMNADAFRYTDFLTPTAQIDGALHSATANRNLQSRATERRLQAIETAVGLIAKHMGGDVLMNGSKVGKVLDVRQTKQNRLTKLSK